MKSGWSFFWGIITGALLFFAGQYVVVNYTDWLDNSTDNISIFKAAGNTIHSDSFKVIQVVDNQYALAIEEILGIPVPTGLVVLIYKKNGNFYDGQIVRTTENLAFREIGRYNYVTAEGFPKTVPVVALMKR